MIAIFNMWWRKAWTVGNTPQPAKEKGAKWRAKRSVQNVYATDVSASGVRVRRACTTINDHIDSHEMQTREILLTCPWARTHVRVFLFYNLICNNKQLYRCVLIEMHTVKRCGNDKVMIMFCIMIAVAVLRFCVVARFSAAVSLFCFSLVLLRCWFTLLCW